MSAETLPLTSTNAPIKRLTSRTLAWAATRETVTLLPRVVRRGWRALLVLYTLQFAAGQFFSYATEYLQTSSREDVLLIAAIAMVELVFTVLWSAVWVLCSCKIAAVEIEVQPQAMPRHFSNMVRYFQPIVIEQIRSLASVIWRTPLLIIPALIQYIRLAFVPFIVLFDPNYEAGEVDALKQSRALSKGQFWLLTIAVGASLLLPSAIEQLINAGNSEYIWVSPLRVSSAAILTFFVDVATTLFLFLMFRAIFVPDVVISMDRNQESPPGTHL